MLLSNRKYFIHFYQSFLNPFKAFGATDLPLFLTLLRLALDDELVPEALWLLTLVSLLDLLLSEAFVVVLLVPVVEPELYLLIGLIELVAL